MSSITIIDANGNSADFDGNCADLREKGRGLGGRLVGSNWNDCIHRIKVHEGRWHFFRDIDYEFEIAVLDPGDHDNPPLFQEISSFTHE